MDTGKRIGVALLALAITAVACGRSPSVGAGPTGLQKSGTVSPADRAEPTGPPNIVLILTDDQRWDTLWAMPTVTSELADRGITFVNGYVSNPLCCPSRASILTGQYSHSNGVYTNHGREPLGGFYGYLAADDYVMKTYGSDRAAYGTTVLAQNAVSFIETTPRGTPLFLYFAPHAPHEPATAAPGDRGAFADLPKWRPPSYDEVDVSDKPEYMQRRVRLDAAARAENRRLPSQLVPVAPRRGPRGRRTRRGARADGRLENTLLVYMADNGMSWGELSLTTPESSVIERQPSRGPSSF